jgi:hypothetical protein
MLSTAGETSS